MTQQSLNCLIACCMGGLMAGFLIVIYYAKKIKKRDLFDRINHLEKQIARMEGQAKEREKHEKF